MNLTMNLTQHINITFTFRTQVPQGKLIQLISFDENNRQDLFLIQIYNGYINFEFNKKILFEINDIFVNDSLWHEIYFSIDYTLNNQNYYYSYYLIRLNNVFSRKIHISQSILFNQFKEFLIGMNFHGCLANLTLNNQMIFLRKQYNNQNQYVLQHIGTTNDCQLAEIETRTLRQYIVKDDLCSMYHPCYYGGLCSNHNTKHGLSFTCNCLKPRFSGRQCQYDLQPCKSHPCLFNQQCIRTSSYIDNRSYSCVLSSIDLPLSTKHTLYIGLIVIFSTLILSILLLFALILYCQRKRKQKQKRKNYNHDKSLVSAPLLIQKSSPPTTNTIESPMQTLLKLNHNGKQTVEAVPLVDNNHQQLTRNNSDDKV